MLGFGMFYLENLGQGHGVQHLQWSHSMTNGNIYKVIAEHYSIALTVFQILVFQFLWPYKCRSRSWSTSFAMAPFDAKYMTENIRFHTGDFFQNFSLLETYIYAKTHTHTHTHTHTYTNKHTHTYTNKHTHTHLHNQKHTHTHTPTQPNTHTHTCAHSEWQECCLYAKFAKQIHLRRKTV